MSEDKTYYVGQSKVVTADLPKEGWVKYGLENGKSGFVTVEQFNNMKSETPYEEEMVRVRKWTPVTAKLLFVLLEADIPMGEVDFVVAQMKQSVLDAYAKATSKLYKRKDEDLVRYSQLHEVIKSDTPFIEE